MSRLGLILCFCCLSAGFTIKGQPLKYYNTWYFGHRAGITFNTKPASVLNDSKIWAFESSTSICDTNGQLLFYTNGDTIFNRLHQPMPNGVSGFGHSQVTSCVQGSMALPVPGSDHLFYLLVGVSNENSTFIHMDSMMRYWVIDMEKNGGLGAVTVKDQPLFQARLENFGATLHANGKDFWVAAVDNITGNFHSTRTINGQFTAPVQKQPMGLPGSLEGSIKFSPDSRFMFGQPETRVQNGKFYQFMKLFKFNNANGRLTDKLTLHLCDTLTPNTLIECFEFSSNSRFLYVNYREDLTRVMVQFDLAKWDSAAIEASRTEIYREKRGSADYLELAGMQLGPDGRIYCFHYSDHINKNNRLSVIERPNFPGKSSNYRLKSINLGKSENHLGAPYYPSFWFRIPRVNLGKDTIICIQDSLKLSCDAAGGSIQWSTGDTVVSIWVKKQGMYTVRLVMPDSSIQDDTIYIRTGPKSKVYIGSDTAFCGKFSHVVKASLGFATYNWSTGDTKTFVSVDAAGQYSVKVLDSNSCPSADTIRIEEIRKPALKLRYDSAQCRYVFLSADSIRGVSYVWNTGDTGRHIRVEKKGLYTIKLSHQFCTMTDSIWVNQLSQPVIDLGPDTILCDYQIWLKTDEPGKYLWNTGETRPSLTVRSPGKYWLTVSRNNCIATDTVNVLPCEDMTFYIPNVFSPDKNHINEVFRVVGTNIVEIRMEIFNRWGEKLLETSGKDPFWDGTYKGDDCQESVYLYTVVLRGRKAGSIKYLSGTVTLLR